MRFYNGIHKYTCGVDLHGKNMHVCLTDSEGKKLVHRRISNNEEEFLKITKAYRGELVVSVESTFNWYWLGDLCAREEIPFVLGHAQYMGAVHQGKTKNDRVDSEKIAKLTSGKLLPQSYVYPKEMRVVRDLFRRRLYFVRERAALKGHVKIVGAQYNVSLVSSAEKGIKTHSELRSQFEDLDLNESIDCDLKTVTFLDSIIRRLEKHALRRVDEQQKEAFELLRSVRGIGDVLGLTILYEMHTVKRFRKVQDFLSYARLVRSEHTSNGKAVGGGGRKIGNPYLKWAFSEAAVRMASLDPRVGAYVEDLKKQYGAAGAWSRLSLKIARSVYYVLKSKKPFDMEKFLKSSEKPTQSRASSLELPNEEGVAMVID